MNSWIRYPHTVEVWGIQRTTNYAGQRMPTWTLNDTVPCFYVPISSRYRYAPTYANINRDQLFIPSINTDGSPIVLTYDVRFKNVRDRDGYVLRGDSDAANVISNDDFFEMHSLIKHTGWAGKLRFYQIIVVSAVEKR